MNSSKTLAEKIVELKQKNERLEKQLDFARQIIGSKEIEIQQLKQGAVN
jgi:hypothetical protein